MKRKAFLKICVLMIAMLLILPSVFSCSKDETPPVETPSDIEDSATEIETDQYGQNVIQSELTDDIDYKGRKINIVIPEAPTYQYEWYTDPASASYSVLDREIHKRNVWVEEYLGVKLNFDIQKAGTSCKLVNEHIQKVCEAGLGGIDIVNNQRAFAATSTLIQYYANLRNDQFTYLDLDDPCWSQNFNEGAKVFERQYYCCGDVNLTYFDRAMVCFFNKKLMDQKYGANKASELYDKVAEGKWYYEDLYNMVKDIHEDVDDVNGESAGDNFGCIAIKQVEAWDALFLGFNGRATEEYDNGRHRIVTGSAVNILETKMSKIVEFWNMKGTYCSASTDENTRMFTTGKALFTIDIIRHTDADMTAKVEMLDGFGILPMPKYDDSQTEFYTGAGDTHNVMSVVKSNATDYYEVMSAVLQALNEESYRSVRPYYIETVMKNQQLDYKSSQVLNGILDSMAITFSEAYNRSVDSVQGRLVRATMRAACGYGSESDPTTLTSAISTYESQCNKAMETLDDFLIYNP